MDRRRDIVHVQLDERTLVRRRPEVERERCVAIFDLLEENSFRLVQGDSGPYNLHLKIECNKLVLSLHTQIGLPLTDICLPLIPFSHMVKDYLMICTTYYQFPSNFTPSKIEAIDIGRRSLHDEGAILLNDLLRSWVEMDHYTARRLFTLLCVLQIRA